MRDQWYSDNRDVVKWSAIQSLVRAGSWNLVYAAMRTPDEPPFDGLRLSNGEPLAAQALSHFRSLLNVQSMAWMGDVEMTTIGELFENRAAYFEQVLASVRGCTSQGVRSTLVFLDPDTGIEPAGGFTTAHVCLEELRAIYEHLRPGDKLAVYQHARRTQTWVDDVAASLSNALECDFEAVQRIQCRELAWDVAMLAVERPA